MSLSDTPTMHICLLAVVTVGRRSGEQCLEPLPLPASSSPCQPPIHAPPEIAADLSGQVPLRGDQRGVTWDGLGFPQVLTQCGRAASGNLRGRRLWPRPDTGSRTEATAFRLGGQEHLTEQLRTSVSSSVTWEQVHCPPRFEMSLTRGHM